MNTITDELREAVQTLVSQIAVLQTSPGAITPEDQAHLDTIEAASGRVTEILNREEATVKPVRPSRRVAKGRSLKPAVRIAGHTGKRRK